MGNTTVNQRQLRSTPDAFLHSTLDKCQIFVEHSLNNFTKYKNTELAASQRVLIERISNLVLDIFSELKEASGTYFSNASDSLDRNKKLFREKQELKTKALLQLSELEGLFAISKRIFHFRSQKLVYWTSLLLGLQADIKYWKKAEAEKYPQFA